MDRRAADGRNRPQLTATAVASRRGVPYHRRVMTQPTAAQSEPARALREEFRTHLEVFYSRLKLAPPYESVEKALRTLTTALHHLSIADQARLLQDPRLKWEEFRRAFETSGLANKHRGIIAGLARNRAALDLPAEYDHFLGLFTSRS
jgi:hypothetical protein